MEEVQSQFSTVLYDDLPVAVYTCDERGYIASYNKAAVELWGREPKIGKDLWCGSWKIFRPDGKPLPLDSCPMARALKERKAIEGEEIIIQRPNGTKRNILPYPVPLFNSSGNLTGAINTLIDITELRKGEDKQATLAAIIESSDDAIISKTLDGIITSWNDAAEYMLGYSAKEVLGKHITLLIPKDRLPEETLIIGKIKQGEKIDHYETVRLTKSGKEIPISLTVSPIRDKKGRIIGASKIARNITIQKASEDILRKYTKNLEILNHLGSLVSKVLDTETILQKVTDETTKLTGAAVGAFFYDTVDEKGESVMLSALSGDLKEEYEEFGTPRNIPLFNATFNGQEVIRLEDITRDPRYSKSLPHQKLPNGHGPVASYLGLPVISSSGATIGGLFFGHPSPGIFKEEHEYLLKGIALQAAIALDNAKLYEEIKKLNAKKDEFIGIASHELKTPLTSMKGYLQLLERNLMDESDLIFVKKTLKQLNNLSNLVSDLLDVSKIQSGKLQLFIETFDFHSLMKEILEIRQQSASHRLLFHSPSTPLYVHADRHRMEQVLNNLITNAIKYSPAADKIDIELTQSGNEIMVTVRDYGIGIPKELEEKIFLRFFRAEGLDSHMSGLGLGLYITKEIIDRHNGKIWVNSEPGEGATFQFSLPLNKPVLEF